MDRKRILIVNDDAAEMYLGHFVLQAEGYEVITAKDGAAGLAAVRATRVDLVFTDVMMPKISGFELCRILREDPATRHIPILVSSARYDDAPLRRVFAILSLGGAMDYLVKPYPFPELILRVKSLLGDH